MRSVGADLNQLFIGECISLAVGVLGLFGLSGGLVGLVGLAGFILIMMALSRLRGSHPGYGRAFTFMVLSIVFAVASVVLLFVAVVIPVLLTVVVPLVMVLSNILNYFVVHYICLSTADLAEGAGDAQTAALGRMIDRIYLVCVAVSVVCTVLSILPLLGKVFSLLAKLASLASIVGLALLVYFLNRAKELLA